MAWLKRLAAATAGLLGLLAIAILVLIQGGFQTLDRSGREVPKREQSDWSAVFARPADITVTPLITGMVSGDRASVMDPDDQRLANLPDRYAPSPVMAHLIVHSEHGAMLVDAGLSETFRDGGNYTPFMSAVLSLIGAENDPETISGAATQLRAMGLVADTILLTHLHADHTSGVADFPDTTHVVFGGKDPTFLLKAMMGGHLSGKILEEIDFAEAMSMPPFDKALDLFGDGSLWAISTPGHSPDHISYLVNGRKGPVLLMGDAVAYSAQLEYQIRPAPGVADQAQAIESLRQIDDFAKKYPSVWIIPGHELTPDERS